ncbi:MAG: UDP-N-acetylmuramoyl-tripeptide--D-alanyl-D-alanine ligase [Endomicrobium sp.]|jgi:UDP-N-acetylmuramoyl-tripeptide--D-alanyl-D-alanine ligase|uniref:UDP-N-acetylmuramoyl-tripeptide--D-alanyl-D- alanine ligase n=1 Tax=Candidatus Endomicrobiellum cubanum TaxID=3242325 RepID=UPI00281C7342|nr:UDP-N-acetylmuramoyl-tripeptide--D-alanyl-D-alanine ligase [Endomicrobium sp.]
MEPCYLSELLPCSSSFQNILVRGISIDSRTILKDEIYFAIEGNRYDGHDFIKDAISKGGCAVVYSKYMCFDDQSISHLNKVAMLKTKDTLVALGEASRSYIEKFKNVKKVGITGSNGKTTTKEMLSSILQNNGKTLSSKGNFNNRIGLPLSAFNLASDIDYSVFEMGTSVFGEINILSSIVKPDIGVITNIGVSHIETFGSLERVLNEKIDLFYNVNKDGTIVINNDDKNLKNLSHKKFKAKKFVSYSLEDINSDVYAKNIKMSENGTNFTLSHNKDSINVFIPVRGIFNVSNALAAASCAIGLGVRLLDIKAGLENFNPPKMRMSVQTTSNGCILINDAYNANPSSVKASIETTLDLYPNKQINLVLGDMLELGVDSDKFHFEMGKFIAAKNINSVSLLGEKSVNIKNAINNKNVFYAKNKEELFLHLKTLLVNNAVFLFKASRGIKLEEVYEKFYNEFLDRPTIYKERRTN